MRKIEFLLDTKQSSVNPILIDKGTETDALVILEGDEFGFVAHRTYGFEGSKKNPVIYQRITSINLQGCSELVIAKEHVHINKIKGTIYLMNKEQLTQQKSLIEEFVYRLV